MKIMSLHPSLESLYNDPNFIIMLESHMTHIRASSNLRVAPVSVLQNSKYKGDFYGLLDDLTIEKKYHYVTMRLNGIKTPVDYSGNMEQVLLPDFDEINLLKNIFQTATL